MLCEMLFNTRANISAAHLAPSSFGVKPQSQNPHQLPCQNWAHSNAITFILNLLLTHRIQMNTSENSLDASRCSLSPGKRIRQHKVSLTTRINNNHIKAGILGETEVHTCLTLIQVNTVRSLTVQCTFFI